jgi:V/A-type H+-transporting ATPase subunit I
MLEMSRLTVAAPVGKLEEVIRQCTNLGCVHIEEYSNFEDGIGIGSSIKNEGSEIVSRLLTKVRSLQSEVNAVNMDGPTSRGSIVGMIKEFEEKVDTALDYVETIRNCESEKTTLEEQLKALVRIAPLGIPLELMSGYEGVEIYLAETSKASKAQTVFSDIIDEIELKVSKGIIAVACQPKDGAAVQIALAELGSKAVQIPSGKGTPGKMIAEIEDAIVDLDSKAKNTAESLESWKNSNGSNLVRVKEHLEREEQIFTAPTLVAVSNQAFALDAWVPTSKSDEVRAALSKCASHVSIEEYVDSHHHHDEGHEEHTSSPKELVMLADYLESSNQSVFQFFKSMDLDDSGQLEFKEIESAMKSADIRDIPPWNMAKFLAAIDLNKDGKINLPELDIAISGISSSDSHSHDDAVPPIEFVNGKATEPFELLVDLVGRPKYGTYDPSMLLMMTFPLFYGMILGDWGYGLLIYLLASFLGSKPFAKDPLAQNGITILKWMGAWCIIWGIIFAEGFGFVWDDTGQLGNSSPFNAFYDWTYANVHIPHAIADLLNLGGLHMPFHRASPGHGLQEYVVLSVYIGIAHIFLGLVIGLVTVYKAHGAAAAYFEKGSWILILTGGSMQARNMVMGYDGLFDVQIWTFLIIIGLASLIVGLAVYEKFGWVGGLIMGPIETFGLLANTLSYLRIMGVGVAGVKIAEVSITMGWEKIGPALDSGDVISLILGVVLFVLIQLFAIALGILSPTIHAVRLHFVEWMGKFYDGSGSAFAPLGGRTLHVEGES